jgi:glycosyl transferase family 25
MKSQFCNKNLDIEFITGVDGRKLDINVKNSLYDGEKARRIEKTISPGEIGCSLSHKSAYEHIVQNNIDRAIILEDDVTLDKNFFTLIPLFEVLPLNKYIIKLDQCNWKQEGDDNYHYAHFTPWHKRKLANGYFIGQPLHDPQLTWGYYIDIKAARTMLALLPKVFLVADAWWYFRKYIKLRMVNRVIIRNNDDIFESIIGDRGRIEDTQKRKSIPALFLHKGKKVLNLILDIFH